MKQRAFTLIETILALSITAVISLAIATMMAAVSAGINAKDDGRQTAIRIATTKTRIAAYVAPSRCIIDKGTTFVTLWLEDKRESNTIHASEIRWIQFDESTQELQVKFVDFPESWSQSLIDSADLELSKSSNFASILSDFELSNLINSISIVDSMQSCSIWANDSDPFEATQISMRFSLKSTMGETGQALIDETIRLHQGPLE